MLPTLWEQFGEGPFLFQSDCVLVHKSRSIKTWLDEFGVEELDWPHRSQTSTPSNTFGVNWNGDPEPDLLMQHKCLTSQMLYWMNVQKLQQKHSKISCKVFPEEWKLLKLQSRTSSILYLEYNVIKVPVGVMVRCSNTFIHSSNIYILDFFVICIVL